MTKGKAARRRGSSPRGRPGRPVNVVFHIDEIMAGIRKLVRRGSSQSSEGVLVSAVSGANAAVTLTLAAIAARRNVIKSLVVSYSAAPTGGRLTITDNAVTVFDADITGAGLVQIPLPDGAENAGVNTAFAITLAAGGAAVVGKISALASQF